ncbi:MAG: hypothetical protein QXW47_01595 [Candidatus Jordarchaeales archaeon]|nr:hypothetical protein [Candidatus Jordarchaeia archaeon]
MTRLVDIAKKVKEQEKYGQISQPPAPLNYEEGAVAHPQPAASLSLVDEKVTSPLPVQVVEKIVYVRKDPKTRLDQNFNVRLPSSFISLLKKKFGERGATVFCRLAILEKMKTVFDELELKELGLFQLLEEQYTTLGKLKSEGG